MKLPPANGCAVCGNVTSKQCSRCKMVKYCSEACQRSDWNSVHKSRCRDFQSSLKGNSEQSASTLQRRKSFGNSHVPFSGKNIILNQSKKVLFPYGEFVEFFYWDSPGYPPCGLKNCGNSCYANVVLQCLTQTKPLVAYLLEKGHRKECRLNDWCFLCEFQLHVERARGCHQTLSPNNIISRLPNIGANLSCGKQEDAHEFMRFAVGSMQSVFLDEFDGDKAVPLNIWETTIIQHIFGGRLHSRVACTKCGNITHQFENMMDLTVEIHGIAESLEDCLDQFTSQEYMDGENLYKCDRCNDYVEAWKSLRIGEAPNILTIALKRFQRGGFGKLNKRVIFPESLYLSPYMSKAGDDNDSFKLYAVIVHVNMLNTSYSGHYICYIKDFSGNWYRVDDSQVLNVNINEVLSQEAYMLLYSRITARPTSLCPLESLNKEDHAIVKVEGKQYSPLQPLECHKTTVSPAVCADPASLPTDNRSEDFRAKEELLSVTNFEGGKEDQDMVNSEASRKVLQELQDVGESSAFEATSHILMLLPPCSVFYSTAEAEGGRFLVSDFEEKNETCKGTLYESLFKSSSEDSVATDDRFLVSDIEEETETCKGTAYESLFRNSSEDSGATNGEMQYLDVPISLSSSEVCQRSDWNSGHKKVLFPYEEFVEFFYWDSPGYPPCGLKNHGNSCYANVVLQCLTQTKPLVAYLLEKGHRRECRLNDWCFLCEFQLHVEQAEWCRDPFLPTDIISRLPNTGGNLSCGKQEDAHEFMRYAIDAMQSVLVDEFDGDEPVPLSTWETTIIQHIFGGHLQSQVLCTTCGNVSKQFENMMDLTVEIHGGAESLEECLDHFTTKECMDGENMYKCDRCNDYVKAWKSLKIREAPNILTIALKRFQREGVGKLNKRVIFPESLDLNPYMSEAGDDDDFFQLYAVIVHVGLLNASNCGHYICYVKDFSGNWYRVDDAQVFNADIYEVSQQEAYMLLYSRMISRPTSLYPRESLNIEDHAIVKAEGMQCSPLQPLECHKTTVSPAICADPASLPTDDRSEIVRTKEELLSVTDFKGGKEDENIVDSGSSRKGTEEEAETFKGTAHESLLGSSTEDSVATNGEMQINASASASASSSSELDNSTLSPKKAKCEKEFSSHGVHDVILKTDGGISSGKKLKPLCLFGKRPRDKCAKQEVRGEVYQNACVQSGLSCEKTKVDSLCTSGFLLKRPRNKRPRDKPPRDKCANQ